MKNSWKISENDIQVYQDTLDFVCPFYEVIFHASLLLNVCELMKN